jgi:hypothetical protein
MKRIFIVLLLIPILLVGSLLSAQGETSTAEKPKSKASTRRNAIRQLNAESDRLVSIALGYSVNDDLKYEREIEGLKKSGYSYIKDPKWKEEVQKIEQRYEELISEFRKKEGSESPTAALLESRLALLFRSSESGDFITLESSAEAVLWPRCPDCKSKEVAQLSPRPNGTFEEQIRTGWWSCRQCSSKPFKIRGLKFGY